MKLRSPVAPRCLLIAVHLSLIRRRGMGSDVGAWGEEDLNRERSTGHKRQYDFDMKPFPSQRFALFFPRRQTKPGISFMSSGLDAYAESNRGLAVRLVSALFRPSVSDFRLNYQILLQSLPQTPEGTVPDIYWDDILEDVKECREQISFCEEHGFPILCVEPPIRGARPTPVLLGLDETKRLFHSRQPIADPLSALEAVTKIRFSPSARLALYSPGDALGFYKAGLSDFLTVRLFAMSAGATNVTRYKFELSTKSKGLTAYWTQAAVLRRGNYFGHPTYPVTGLLPAGNYCFGAGLTGGTATYDMTTYFDIPNVDKGYINV